MIFFRTLIIVLVSAMVGNAFASSDLLPRSERIVLDNGTVLILHEKHDVPLIGLRAIVRGGAIADPPDKHGLTDLLAGLLEKGAGDRSSAEFAEAIAAVGGQLGASANLESLSVSADFLARDAMLMVELVSDLLLRPTLAAREFEKLRTRSINLIKAAKGSDPDNLMPSYANAFLFGEHPYGNPVGGSESSLAAITHRDLIAHYAAATGGDRLIIAVSGDFEIAAMRAALSAAFGDWRPATVAAAEVAAPTSVAERRVFLIDKPGATQTYFYIGNVGVARGFSGGAELDLANTVFGGRFTSMLMTELRTKSGLSYSARSRLSRHSQPGSVFISSFTETSTTVAALDVALNTLSQLRDNELSDEMLASARNYVMGQFPPRLETAAQLANQFAALEAYGLDASYVNNYGAGLEATSAASVAAVVGQVYPPSDRLVFIILGDAGLIRDDIARYGPVTEISIALPRFHP